MPLRLNFDAVTFAEHLIGEGDYRINTVWSEARPSVRAAQAFFRAHGPEEFRLWYLLEDTDCPPDAPERYQLPLGDFKNVHRSGLIAARDSAVKQGQPEVEQAAEDLLFFFDRISAC